MRHDYNSFGQPLGMALEHWQAPPFPPRQVLTGQWCRVEPLDPEQHAGELWTAYALDSDGKLWTYLPYGPFDDFASYKAWLTQVAQATDPQFYVIMDIATQRAVGVAAYMRIDPANGVIEVGHLCFSPLMQEKVIATEAMYLMMANAFDLGYRRYEWKCNAYNHRSRQAAQRLGLSFEGVFRQAAVVKGRNRDTAWYATIDRDWPELKQAYAEWLDPANFDANGRQRQRLSNITYPLLKQYG